VVAQPCAKEELGLIEGTEYRRELWAYDRGVRIARVCGLQHGIHRRRKIIAAQTEGGSPPVGPARRILSVDADIALVHVVEEGVREKLAAERVGQTDIDIVIACLQPDHCLARQAE
jgi:hypothetical protein